MTNYTSGPSLQCPSKINPDADADVLYAACKGMNKDEASINKLLGRRNFQQRMQIRDAYNRKYGKDLVEVLKGSTKGDYDSLLQTLFRNPIQILAYDLYKGMKGTGTNKDVLNEIICCCNNSEIQQLKQAYQDCLQQYDPKKAAKRSLEIDVSKEASGTYETLLLTLLRGQRQMDNPELVEEALRTKNMSGIVNQSLVARDVEDLYAAGEGKSGKGEADVFIRILCDRSKYHIRAIWDLYKRKYNNTLVEAISKEFSEPLQSGLNTTVMALVNLRLLLMCQLYDSMKGAGTREDTLIRIICLRSELDLNTLKTMYRENFNKPLMEAVRDETTGDFRTLLLYLMGE